MSQPQPQRRQRRRIRQRSRAPNSLQPPQFDPTITLTHKFRFQATGALTNVQILSNAIIARLVMAATATTSFSLFTAFKLNRVQMWGPPASDLQPVTISLEFVSNSSANSSVGTKPRVFSDTSVGATRVAHLSARPAPNSSAAMWQTFNTQGSSATDTAGAGLILNGPTGTIVDLDVALVIQNGETALAGPAPTAATVGTIYATPLDSAGADLLQPVSYLPLS